MAKLHIFKFLIVVIFATSILSCYKEPDFSIKPVITFNKISTEVRLDQDLGGVKDSIIVSINFQDGDGDLGINTEEIKEFSKKFGYNYDVETLREVNGTFQKYETLETYSGYFPRLKTDGKIGPIEGILSYRIEILHAFWEIPNAKIKFKVSIKDRAGNTSNVIETEPIIIKKR